MSGTTNREIIRTAVMLNGIAEPVNTYAGWKRTGLQVKKGEKALFCTKIWKPIKDKNTDKAAVIPIKMIMVKAAFFGLSQVEEISKKR